MRLFAAIRLPDELKTSIIGTMHELKKAGIKGNYVPVQDLHLTVASIGEIKDPAPVIEILKKVSFKPFHLSLSDMGCSGNQIWIGIKGNQGLSGVAKSVREALDEAGIIYDRKNMIPQITIIRKATGKWQQVLPPKGESTIKRLSLMKADTKDGKQIFTDLM